jgi:chromodomain-helicase-DNA-binding protein 1
MRYILTHNFRELNAGLSSTHKTSLNNVLMEMKKACNSPYLFERANIEGGGGVTGATDAAPSSSAARLSRLISSSGKMVLLDKLLTRLKATGHRVLIFSLMVRMLDLLGEFLALRGHAYQRLDGSTSAPARQLAMDHYNAPGSTDFVFLLSTRAGGLGINLHTVSTNRTPPDPPVDCSRLTHLLHSLFPVDCRPIR